MGGTKGGGFFSPMAAAHERFASIRRTASPLGNSDHKYVFTIQAILRKLLLKTHLMPVFHGLWRSRPHLAQKIQYAIDVCHLQRNLE